MLQLDPDSPTHNSEIPISISILALWCIRGLLVRTASIYWQIFGIVVILVHGKTDKECCTIPAFRNIFWSHRVANISTSPLNYSACEWDERV